MTRILAIANAKGGVGKTTTTINLAAALAEHHMRVLVVDLDPQASLTLSLGIRGNGDVKSIYHALVATGMPLAAMIRATPEGFDIVPASHELNQAVDVLEGGKRRLFAVRAVLEPIRERYDYILMDCPANAGILTGSALAAAGEVLIPLAVDYLALESLGWFLTVVKQVREKANSNLKITGIFFTMFDPRTRHARQIMESARQTYGAEIPFFATSVRYSAGFRDASLAGKSMLRYESKAPASEAYRSLAREIEKGLGITPENEIYSVISHADEATIVGDLAAAYWYYCRATDLDPQLARAWIGRAQTAREWEEKIRCYCRALPLTLESGAGREGLVNCVSPEQMSLVAMHPLIACAHQIEAAGEKELAEKVYAFITERDPKHEQAWLGRAHTASHVLDAARYIRKCLEINPKNALAQEELKGTLERAATESMQYVERGVAEARQGKKQQALALIEQACELDPQSDRAWVERARVTEDYAVARSYARRALELNPRNSEARELSNFLYSPADPAPAESSNRVGMLIPLVVIAVLVFLILATIYQFRWF